MADTLKIGMFTFDPETIAHVAISRRKIEVIHNDGSTMEIEPHPSNVGRLMKQAKALSAACDEDDK